FVSLFFDSYVPLDMGTRISFIEKSVTKIDGALGKQTAARFKEHWKPTLLQRQLKAVGSFGYLTLVKNRGNYLQYVPAALSILEEKIIYDQRWSFLSGEFLQQMRTKVQLQYGRGV